MHEDSYLDVLAKVQTKVLAAFDPLRNTLKSWDEEFFLKHNQREPQLEDYSKDKDAFNTYKKFSLCKQLLKHWKITAHLK